MWEKFPPDVVESVSSAAGLNVIKRGLFGSNRNSLGVGGCHSYSIHWFLAQ